MTDKKETIYRWRHVARIVIEAATPLMVGSGDKSVETDSEVAVDANGLPFIPGSALAGVLRHAAGVRPDEASALWGYVDGDDGRGSRLFFSEARLIGKEGEPVDGLNPSVTDDHFYDSLTFGLPVRHHVRIGHRGTAENAGKYDNRVVLKGVRLCFEVEAIGTDRDDESAAAIADVVGLLSRGDVRFGGGTRSGYGEVKLISATGRTYDLESAADFEAYAALGTRLSASIPGGESIVAAPQADGCEVISLKLRPDSFFLFGAAQTDLSGDADMMPVTEKVVEWNGGKPTISEAERLLVPASSVKGAIAHRTAFYYNKLKGIWADAGSLADHVGQRNEAVQDLFGYQEEGGSRKLHRGKVMISDVLLKDGRKDKLLNHVKIDRFTSGAEAGALFTERVATSDSIELKVVIESAADVKPMSRKALFMALRDIAKGMLPLGGGVGRGNGIFRADDESLNLINNELAEA